MKPSNAIRGKEGAIKRLVESYGFVSPQLFGSTGVVVLGKGDDAVGKRAGHRHGVCDAR